MKLTLALVVIAVAFGTGCASEDEAHDHEDDPAELACEETSEEGTAIEATPDRGDDAPELELGGEPYTVTPSETDPSFVRVEITEDTEAILLVSLEDAVSALYHEDEEEELVSAGPVEHCASEIPEHFDIDFHEPGTYYLELAPSAADTLWLLLSDAAGHAHEHEH